MNMEEEWDLKMENSRTYNNVYNVYTYIYIHRKVDIPNSVSQVNSILKIFCVKVAKFQKGFSMTRSNHAFQTLSSSRREVCNKPSTP